ncbi:orphan sodium- and chloride-dependent neurotransmitter transporter NTT5-like isoform X2 [Choloepus didactylus]|uniref:orphan sodium- and chloride-dependent neurotransmitter transporter NTT5-like isoform X2 n=1 Tax=Choloepus didactylus TaxID=27675 RepID=UPI00189E6130|nr:orphan sodium- and chloride-dependent neurotransmitter transporter NTT5-like isoform X2 [Choloepus didactylus]
MDFVEESTDMEEDELPGQSVSPRTPPLARPPAKETWATKTQTYFTQMRKNENILIQVAFSVGVGSIWRFPYLCHRNGGGSFLLLYLFMLVFVGIPLLYMEMIMGQWLRMDNMRIWKHLVPCLGGMGYASMLVCILMSLYNSVIISWSLSYLCHAFHYHLPWNSCPLVKNSNNTDLSCLRTVPHQYFWYHTTLRASGSLEEGVEALVLNLSLGIFAAWFFLCVIMITGLKISMPMLIFSIFFPSIILLCLLVRCLFLEGAGTSLKRVMTTELSALASLDLWRQAGGHVLYSLSLGMGTVTTFSSKFRGNSSVQMTLWVALVNLVTSMLATTTIFLVLGFWAASSGHACVEKSVSTLMNLIATGVLPQGAKPPESILLRPNLEYLNWIDQLPQHLQHQIIHFSPPCSIKTQKETFMDGPGLALVAFSQAVLLFPGAPFWTIIFFLAMLIMGLDTLLKILEGIVLPLQVAMPTFRNHPRLLSVVICVGGFLGSLIFTSHSGNYILCLFDDHLIPLTLVVIVIFQNVALAWIYGAKSLTQIYRRTPPYYIAWNASASQEVKQPFLKHTLAWLSFLSVLSLLPIPAHPFQHWWYQQDPVSSEPTEKKLPFKKVTPDSPKSLQWPKYPLKNPSFLAQEKTSAISSRGFGKPLGRGPNLESFWHVAPATPKQGSQNSSWLSLPHIGSLSSMLSTKSISLPPSRQVSLASVAADSGNLDGDTRKGNLPSTSVQ